MRTAICLSNIIKDCLYPQVREGDILVRAAALVAGDDSVLHALLDSIYFSEIPNLELAAVISCEKNSNAMRCATSAGIPAFMVDPELFPTNTSYSMAIANKLKDMDIDFVILAGYNRELGVIPYQYKNRVIGTYPSLIPSFEGDDLFRAALERGAKITGATAYFADVDGCVGNIILQKAVDIHQDDTPESLAYRVFDEAEKELLPKAIALFCAGRLGLHGNRVVISGRSNV